MDSLDWSIFGYRESGPPDANETFGYPFHENFGALTESASQCEVCELIRESLARFLDGHQKAQQRPDWEYRYKGWANISADCQLWLTSRLDEGKGFLVFAKRDATEEACLVAALGLCAEDGSSCLGNHPILFC